MTVVFQGSKLTFVWGYWNKSRKAKRFRTLIFLLIVGWKTGWSWAILRTSSRNWWKSRFMMTLNPPGITGENSIWVSKILTGSSPLTNIRKILHLKEGIPGSFPPSNPAKWASLSRVRKRTMKHPPLIILLVLVNGKKRKTRRLQDFSKDKGASEAHLAKRNQGWGKVSLASSPEIMIKTLQTGLAGDRTAKDFQEDQWRKS